jgi:phospholipase/carboxylesterase
MLTRALVNTPLRHDGVVLDSSDLLSWTWQASTDLPSVVLLHGSGQDEHTLLAFAQAAGAGHTLTAVRGRISWEGGYAFFRRRLDRTLDEADLAQGAAAIQRLLVHLQDAGRRPPILLGYSNGAIAAAAAILDDRLLSAGAILLRPLSPLPERAFPRLDGYPILLVSAEDDSRRDPSDGPSLDSQFRAAGAASTLVVLPVGHGLTAADQDAVTAWLLDLNDQPAAP